MTEAGGGQESESSNVAVQAAVAAGGCGCLAIPVGGVFAVASIFVMGGFGVLLMPLVILIMLFKGLLPHDFGGGINTDLTPVERICEDLEAAQHTPADQLATRTQQIALGDGLGTLEITPPSSSSPSQPCTVPADLYEAIQDAGSVCDVIGPVTIAAQIQYETGFDADFVGPNGAKGVSQVPTDVFERLHKDGDPLDAKQSIKAQGAYLCELAAQAQSLIDAGEVTGSVLDLTLAAYDVSMDNIRKEHGVPATEEAQSYVIGVRTWFASMEGIGPPPRTMPDGPGLRDT
ncbi:lytic transglycosylase domain-containing protein [Streptomyces sp. NPDC046909]|uniref:lytic transglycosylase domain-containing protein n=1 Tax=Streptomyces sp. NPDC046909 TaxID=3155617 RepID=UPI0033D08629